MKSILLVAALALLAGCANSPEQAGDADRSDVTIGSYIKRKPNKINDVVVADKQQLENQQMTGAANMTGGSR